MTEDPRWQRALKLLRQAEAAYGRGDPGTMARALECCLNTLDSLSLDPAVARLQRRRAAKLLDKIDGQVAAHLPALLHRVAEMRDTATNAGRRAEFAEMMTGTAARKPAVSGARH